MKFVADFHIHSKYSRATSRDMDIPHLTAWAKRKGIGLLGSGDFTHHLWLQELKRYFEPQNGKGLFVHDGVNYILTAEISSIFSQNGKGYRVHNVIMAPSFKVVEEINKMLATHGNLASDGRPILGMSCIQLAAELTRISEEIMIVPGHVWTPWFGVFGSNSGFNSLEEAFGAYTKNITALETGLSSDPAMNWRLSALDKYSLISNSDSHSPAKIGREANVFDCDMDYWEIRRVLKEKDRDKFLFTVEFFPEEGKYHYDGHRNCQVRQSPEETKKNKGLCPVCHKPVTRGVMYRVDELADRPEGFVPENAIGFKRLVPLGEIIAEVKGTRPQSKAVEQEYSELINAFGSEFEIMVNAAPDELKAKAPEKIAQAITRVREGKLSILPGYDGEYGVIRIFGEETAEENQSQLSLF